MDVKARIVYIHPAIRSYRLGMFEKLHNNFTIDFFWSEVTNSDPNIHIAEETSSILAVRELSSFQGKELGFLPIRGFSFSLLSLPFKNYNIYVFSNITSIPFLLLAPVLGILGKKVIIFDEMWRYPIEIRKYRIIFPYVRKLLKFWVSGVVAAGSKAKGFYINDLGFDSNQVEVAYNTTVDLRAVRQYAVTKSLIRNRVSFKTKKSTLLYLGRIVEYKGLDVLIRSMVNVDVQYDLVIVGDGPFKELCLNLVEQLKLGDRVHFMGSCLSKEAVYYYDICDIFILPTRFKYENNVQIESWGFTVNEAMSLEMPVIATTAVGSAYDLVINGVTGGIADAGSVESLVSTINLVIKNNDCNKIGRQARYHLIKTCDHNKNLKSYSRLFSKVLA